MEPQGIRGAIHEGNGEALILVDERADDRQRTAIATLVEGHVGGPWGVLTWTWPRKHGPMAVPYEVDLKGVGSRIKAGTVVEIDRPRADPNIKFCRRGEQDSPKMAPRWRATLLRGSKQRSAG